MNFLSKILLVLVFFSVSYAQSGFPDEYYKMSSKKAKDFFFEYFEKRIEIENIKILADRLFIKSLEKSPLPIKGSLEYEKLEFLQKRYKIQDIFDYPKYIKRIDIVPPSMALAQAATESGWGKSRFFKQANNIFGHWTYNPKIGMVPLDRPEGKRHLVRVFATLEDSIAAYMLNLNRTSAYKNFRTLRENMRNSKIFINGLSLSATMTKYSGIGHDYVKILQSIITKNKLIEYDIKFFEKIKNLD
ncbi:glucosaminidase domain-containing protein [Halarcobacter sp.]|uniref:glucosaminidase domain-containing protein n=1 Tax=Halarcobacter sp. TaxID=2321133 RepID=UPI0029F54EF3|nr:glucosaminidase domain-containing protein [Halarcobacter sp.]